MSILLQLLITAPPSTKILVLKILQHLVKIQIPFEIFEESVALFKKDKETFDSYYGQE
jgi:hypothetical protein